MGLLDRLAALDDRFWVKREPWVRTARGVAYGIGAVAVVLVLLGFAIGFTEFGLALAGGVGAVVLAACVSGWVGRRRHAKLRS